MSTVNVPVYKFTMYEIPLVTTSSGTQFNFPINNYLVGRKVYGMEVYNSDDIDRSPISTSNATLTAAQLRTCSLTLHCYDPTKPNDSGGVGDWIQRLPLNALHRIFNTDAAAVGNATFEKMLFGGLMIDWNNSHIDFTQNQTFLVNQSCLFGVYYL